MIDGRHLLLSQTLTVTLALAICGATATADTPTRVLFVDVFDPSFADSIRRAMEAKKEFVADLRAKYGDFTALNTAWGTRYGSWRELLDSRTAPDKTRARQDLTAFYARTAQTYFRIVREGIKAVAPNQLYLEYSRDIEPLSGGHGDTYFLQRVSPIRRFKGTRPRTIDSTTGLYSLGRARGQPAPSLPRFSRGNDPCLI